MNIKADPIPAHVLILAADAITATADKLERWRGEYLEGRPTEEPLRALAAHLNAVADGGGRIAFVLATEDRE